MQGTQTRDNFRTAIGAKEKKIVGGGEKPESAEGEKDDGEKRKVATASEEEPERPS